MNTRNRWTQHEFGKIVPSMTPSEFDGLKEDIRNNGLLNPGLSFEGQLLDGWHRFLICNELHIDFPVTEFVGTRQEAQRRVISLNLNRRHLSQDQKREVIAALLMVSPERSDRDIAEEAKVDHKTVSRVRRKQEQLGRVPQLAKTVGRDGKSRPARKPKKGGASGLPPLVTTGGFTALTPQEVDPDFKGNSVLFAQKYGHVPRNTAEKHTAERFAEWSVVMAQCAKPIKASTSDLREVDIDKLRSVKASDVQRMQAALDTLRPVFAKAEAMLARFYQVAAAAESGDTPDEQPPLH